MVVDLAGWVGDARFPASWLSTSNSLPWFPYRVSLLPLDHDKLQASTCPSVDLEG